MKLYNRVTHIAIFSLAAAKAVKHTHEEGKVVEGTIGSADVWNNEVVKQYISTKTK